MNERVENIVCHLLTVPSSKDGCLPSSQPTLLVPHTSENKSNELPQRLRQNLKEREKRLSPMVTSSPSPMVTSSPSLSPPILVETSRQQVGFQPLLQICTTPPGQIELTKHRTTTSIGCLCPDYKVEQIDYHLELIVTMPVAGPSARTSDSPPALCQVDVIHTRTWKGSY